MRCKLLVALCLLFGFPLSAWSDDVKGDEVKGGASKSGDAMQGTWLPLTAEFAGQKFPDKLRSTIKLAIKGDQYTVTVGKAVDRGTVKLDPSAKPKALDIVGAEGPNKGKTMLAIYEFDGKELRICYDLSGKRRPTEYKTKADTQLFLVTYKREESQPSVPSPGEVKAGSEGPSAPPPSDNAR